MQKQSLFCYILTISSIAAGGCSQPAPAPVPAEKQVAANPESGRDSTATLPSSAVIEALAFVEEVGKQCEELGHDVVTQINYRGSGEASEGTYSEYLRTTAAARAQAVTTAAHDATNLASAAGRDAGRSASMALVDLSYSCQSLCAQAANAYQTSEEYKLGFVKVASDYRTARLRFYAAVPVSQRDLQPAQERARAELEKRTAIRVEVAQSIGIGVEEKPRTLSPEEYAREQAEWKAAQERMEQERATHEAAMNEWWHGRSAKPQAPAGTVGVRPLESSPPPPSPTDFRPWHAAWGAKAPAAKAALFRYQTLAPARDPGLQGVCSELSAAGQAALADRAVLGSPDPNLNVQVLAFFNAVKSLGDACQSGQAIETVYQRKNAEHSLSQVEGTMRRYSLQP